ncbi:MAG: fumarylacetoacetate hydrolase family protein [Phycisphaeraceae bacterium]|nr:MAG: fumarylacetoacetate hydrolase family protein [Phycisphaeraceae bacterium]
MKLTRNDLGVCVGVPGVGEVHVRHIIGVGMNYAEHAREQGKEPPTRPVFFTKNPASAVLDGDVVVIPEACRDRPQVDFEAELAVVLGVGGKPVKDVPRERALGAVLGYACANDVSARWWQKEGSGGQFYRGKSFDTFCPIGPTVVPAAEVGDPGRLRIACRVNGVTMQDGTTGDMIFDVATLIAEASRGTTLLPGTVILTGTPSGVGFARTPPVFLKGGDVVEVEIEGLGVLRNPVRG